MRAIAPFTLALLAACTSSKPPLAMDNGEHEVNVDPLVTCLMPRPQVCTMLYAPVCAQRQDGVSTDYSSPCNACADDQVVAYVDGACDDSDLLRRGVLR